MNVLTQKNTSFTDVGILRIEYCADVKKVVVHLAQSHFLDYADGHSIKHEERGRSLFPHELSFESGEVLFYSIATDEIYEEKYASLFEVEDEEFLVSQPRGVTSEEVAMRDAGHKQSDFI
ncbi:hypothetical protein QGM71_01040 [Virgibacillus sp. C22-A2]|uniref:Uncharacterized protein n=1 Tax=Virgibacillus tibetensis TaxID=3042313 RepID=A0ABU6K9P3_9BACI|nr:hypothetical protein [Virgibacillus sp. C22-A2]